MLRKRSRMIMLFWVIVLAVLVNFTVWGRSALFPYQTVSSDDLVSRAISASEFGPPNQLDIVAPAKPQPIRDIGPQKQTVHQQAKATPKPKESGCWYSVKERDTLWGIAKKRYGRGLMWKQVANANDFSYKEASRIYPNHMIWLPSTEAIASSDRAPTLYMPTHADKAGSMCHV